MLVENIVRIILWGSRKTVYGESYPAEADRLHLFENPTSMSRGQGKGTTTASETSSA